MKPVKDNNSNKPGGGGRGKSQSANRAGGQVVKGSSLEGNINNKLSADNNNGKKEGKRDFRGSRRWRRDRDRNRDRNKDSELILEQDPNRVIYKCELCGKDIKDIYSAIDMNDSHNPVHFDCMLEKLKKENTLESTDKVVYLGAGNFGVVRIEKGKSGKDFKIVKKLEVESKGDKPEWRTLQIKAR